MSVHIAKVEENVRHQYPPVPFIAQMTDSSNSLIMFTAVHDKSKGQFNGFNLRTGQLVINVTVALHEILDPTVVIELNNTD